MDFLNNYSDEVSALIKSQSIIFKKVASLIKKNSKRNKIIICGNGGSSSIASHVATDITKILNKKTLTFADDNLITCYANDYGYENWTLELMKIYLEPKDLVILISSSSMSQNIVNAAKYIKTKKNILITLTGFNKKNKLKKYGNVNVWVDSKKYNIIEMVHHIFLVAIIDSLSND